MGGLCSGLARRPFGACFGAGSGGDGPWREAKFRRDFSLIGRDEAEVRGRGRGGA